MKQDVKIQMKNVDVKEVLQGKIVKFGTGGHIIIPQKHIGKEAIIIIKK